MSVLLFVLAATSGVAGDYHPHTAHQSGEDACTTGCSVPKLPKVSDAEVDQLLRLFAEEPVRGDGPAAEALFFHADAVRRRLETTDVVLPEDHEALLRRELARTHVLVSVRVTDEHGEVRLRVDDARVPLGEKRHVPVSERVRLGPLELSGTVVRVGLKHLWNRY